MTDLDNKQLPENAPAGEEKKKEWKYYPTRFTLGLRAMIGGYLVYTAYQLFQSITHDAQGREKYFLAAFMVGFALIGLGLLAYSIYNLKKGRYEGGPADDNERSEGEELSSATDVAAASIQEETPAETVQDNAASAEEEADK